ERARSPFCDPHLDQLHVACGQRLFVVGRHEIVGALRKSDAAKQLAAFRIASLYHRAVLPAAHDAGITVEAKASLVLALPMTGDAMSLEKRLDPGTIKGGRVFFHCRDTG